MVVGLDQNVAELTINGNNKWQVIKLSPSDFKNVDMKPRSDWNGIMELRLDDEETLRPPKKNQKSKHVN